MVVAILWLVLAPICQAQCVYASDAETQSVSPAAVANDCHSSPKVEPSSTTAECDWPHEPTHAGGDRIDAPPAMVATLWLPPILPLTPAVRVAARQDPALHDQGPPLRLLTLRFIE